MEKYVKAQMEIVAFETEDVIRTSPINNTSTGTSDGSSLAGPDWGGESDNSSNVP